MILILQPCYAEPYDSNMGPPKPRASFNRFQQALAGLVVEDSGSGGSASPLPTKLQAPMGPAQQPGTATLPSDDAALDPPQLLQHAAAASGSGAVVFAEPTLQILGTGTAPASGTAGTLVVENSTQGPVRGLVGIPTQLEGSAAASVAASQLLGTLLVVPDASGCPSAPNEAGVSRTARPFNQLSRFSERPREGTTLQAPGTEMDYRDRAPAEAAMLNTPLDGACTPGGERANSDGVTPPGPGEEARANGRRGSGDGAEQAGSGQVSRKLVQPSSGGWHTKRSSGSKSGAKSGRAGMLGLESVPGSASLADEAEAALGGVMAGNRTVEMPARGERARDYALRVIWLARGSTTVSPARSSLWYKNVWVLQESGLEESVLGRGYVLA